jgi:hypothetical protein
MSADEEKWRIVMLRWRSQWIAFCGGSLVGVAVLLGAVSTAAAQGESVNVIREHMEQLRPWVGSWTAEYEFHEKDGTALIEPGTWTVAWMLDDTYLQVQAAYHRREDPGRHRGYINYITYDPVTKKYICTFFYERSAIRVTEDGLFDEQTKELRTSGLVPLEDGKRDEHVRNIYKLEGADSIINLHYSQYVDEPRERLQLVIRLRRSEQSKAKSSR